MKKIARRVDFYQLGYDMAYGEAGTGWMVFDEEDCAREYGKDCSVEDVCGYVEGWTETEQWDYEVGRLIRDEIGEIDWRDMASEKAEDRMYDFADKRDEWMRGYVDAALTMMKK